jgi:uncharacterized protein (TIGR03435 family)
MKAMLQKLLADRFSLNFNNEKRELSAYAITVAKGGEKIQKEQNSNIPVPLLAEGRSSGLTSATRRWVVGTFELFIA